MSILNLTQHPATVEQLAAGVIDIAESRRDALLSLLTFATLPSTDEVEFRAKEIAKMSEAWLHGILYKHGAYIDCPSRAMIGGAPYLMAPLEVALNKIGIRPCYAYSERISQEQVQQDGSVRKINTFKHAGFVEVSL